MKTPSEYTKITINFFFLVHCVLFLFRCSLTVCSVWEEKNGLKRDWLWRRRKKRTHAMLCESNCTKKKLMSNECTSLLRRRACVTNQFSLFVLLFFSAVFGRCSSVCLCTWLSMCRCEYENILNSSNAYTCTAHFFLCSLLVIKPMQRNACVCLRNVHPVYERIKKNSVYK